MENINPSFQIGIGTVMHQRNEKNLLSFRYPIFNVIIPEDSLDQSEIKFNLFWFLKTKSVDYIDKTNISLKTKIRRFLNEKLNYVPDSIQLQTIPRMFGYVFNPISFWLCYKETELDAVLCEVNNTFNDKHYYFIRTNNISNSNYLLPKEFHVSPFFPIKGRYLFNFEIKNKVSNIGIKYFDESGTLQLTTQLNLKIQQPSELSALNLLLKFGWMTPLILVRIHVLALKLFLKKVKFYNRPNPPTLEVTK